MEPWRAWYDALVRPSWTPESATIGTIWSIIYPTIILTHGFVIVQALRGKLSWMVALPFIINIIANLAFSPILFWFQQLALAEADILIVLITIIWSMAVIWKTHRWVALVQIPYLIWVSIATTIMTSITLNN